MVEISYSAPYRLKKGYRGDSCYDLRVWGLNGEKIRLEPGETAKVGTGVKFHIPEGYEVQVRGRSGLSSDGVLVHMGTVDSGYTGEVKVVVSNLSKFPFFIEDEMRIAQAFVGRVPEVSLLRAEEEEEERKKEKESKNSHYILAEVPASLLRELKIEAKIAGKVLEEFCGLLLKQALEERRGERGFLLRRDLEERRGERGDQGFGSTGK